MTGTERYHGVSGDKVPDPEKVERSFRNRVFNAF